MRKTHTTAIKITADGKQAIQEMRRVGQSVQAQERAMQRVSSRMAQIRQNIQRQGVMGRGGSMVRQAAGMAGVFGFQDCYPAQRRFYRDQKSAISSTAD